VSSKVLSLVLSVHFSCQAPSDSSPAQNGGGQEAEAGPRSASKRPRHEQEAVLLSSDEDGGRARTGRQEEPEESQESPGTPGRSQGLYRPQHNRCTSAQQ